MEDKKNEGITDVKCISGQITEINQIIWWKYVFYLIHNTDTKYIFHKHPNRHTSVCAHHQNSFPVKHLNRILFIT